MPYGSNILEHIPIKTLPSDFIPMDKDEWLEKIIQTETSEDRQNMDALHKVFNLRSIELNNDIKKSPLGVGAYAFKLYKRRICNRCLG